MSAFVKSKASCSNNYNCGVRKMKKLFCNAKIVVSGKYITGSVLVHDGTIIDILPSGADISAIDAEIIDCSDLYLGPGLIDIHVHGGMGVDFIDADAYDIAKGIGYHLSMGTTSIVPSCISVPFNTISGAIDNLKQAAKTVKSTVLGFHIEGIYLDEEYRGGHLKDYLCLPDPAEYMPLIEEHGDYITEWTLAPELGGSIELIKKCREYGIVSSAGHTQASYDTMMKAIDAGLTHTTHFVCAMGTLRDEALGETPGTGYAPGVVETVLLDDRLTTEVIADGIHLHPAIIQLAFKCKGVGGLCIVSDSMMGVGLPPNEYVIGGQDCIVDHGIAILKDRPNMIASSVTPMIDMLRFVVNRCGILLYDAWEMSSLTAAKIIRFDEKKGSIEAGKDADIVLLDNDLKLAGVYAAGTLI